MWLLLNLEELYCHSEALGLFSYKYKIDACILGQSGTQYRPNDVYFLHFKPGRQIYIGGKVDVLRRILRHDFLDTVFLHRVRTHHWNSQIRAFPGKIEGQHPLSRHPTF